MRIVRTAWAVVRRGWREEVLVQERLGLLDRPWEETFLHVACDGSVHGTLLPPQDGRRHSVTSDGWCPGWARMHPRDATTP